MQTELLGAPSVPSGQAGEMWAIILGCKAAKTVISNSLATVLVPLAMPSIHVFSDIALETLTELADTQRDHKQYRKEVAMILMPR